MARLLSVVTAFAAFSAVSADSTPTVENSCVLANFETATSDFIALNNLVTIIKTSPALLKSYIGDPLIIENQTLTAQDFSLLGYDFTYTPTIDSLNVTGITTISPMAINVTGSNTLDLGADFTGTLSLAGTATLGFAQPNRQWYEACLVNLLDPLECKPKTVTMDFALALSKPEIVTNVEANLYECAPGISTSVCTNLTVTSILVGALGGDLSSVGATVLKHFKDAELNTLTLGWDAITNIEFAFHDSSALITLLTNTLLGYSADELNKKDAIYDVFIEVAQKLALAFLNNFIDTEIEPLFGATCL